ncbi:hypothetical protein [Leisingera sp. M523]|uniref:hypothetical protein n=1 Tax=Leisingera sp. M523 TaxID=2867013 RepID=UPI0021A2FC14|nr:hypothetical protein [Leisingera sp. M523]UWQ31052.1 hypothetical protein K3557_04430 [Leisingera sp. M523]
MSAKVALCTAEAKKWRSQAKQILLTAREACTTVRHILTKQGLPVDEHFFFRREMHFAGKIGSIWQRLPYLLFGLFSGYGYPAVKTREALMQEAASCIAPAPPDGKLAKRPLDYRGTRHEEWADEADNPGCDRAGADGGGAGGAGAAAAGRENRAAGG